MDYQIKRIFLDADTLIYSAGFVAEKELLENPDYPVEAAQSILSNMIINIFTNLSRHLKQDLLPKNLIKSGQLKLFLTANDGSNFRYKLATQKIYKGNRAEKSRPFYYDTFRQHLMDNYCAKLASGYEADDAISIAVKRENSPQNTMVIAQDKDLRQIPCWHYWYSSSDKFPKKPFYVTPEGYMQLERSNSGSLEVYATGTWQIAYQMIAGDTSDNIPSIERGWGPMKVYDYLSNKPAGMCPIDYAYELYETVHGQKKGIQRADEVYNLVKLLEEELIYDN